MGPVWHGGGRGEPDLLASCYRTSLTRALELNCRTVAFPAISTGVYHYPPQEAAAIAVAECRRFLMEHPDGPEIIFVCFSGHMAAILSLIHISHPRHGSRKHQASGFHSIAWIFERSLKARRSATPACPRVRFMIH